MEECIERANSMCALKTDLLSCADNHLLLFVVQTNLCFHLLVNMCSFRHIQSFILLQTSVLKLHMS